MHETNRFNFLSTSKTCDWTCPCGELIFAKRNSYQKCTKSRTNSQPAITPGDWLCGSCNEMNFALRTVCMQCALGKDYKEKKKLSCGHIEMCMKSVKKYFMFYMSSSI